MTVPLDIYRFDPGRDQAPRFQRYLLDLPPHTPLLTALLRVRDEMDPTLTLRYSCRHAICGSCAMVINSKSRLACKTPVGPEVARHGRIAVEPMHNLPVLRDLVVDLTPFFARYRRVRPHLIADPVRPPPEGRAYSMTEEQVARFEDTPRCIACASCYSACPAVESDAAFPGPMALAKLFRYVVDPRDSAHRERLLQIQSDGLWICMRCHLCTDSCPKNVRPSERIIELKEMAVRVAGATESGSRHAIGFKDNIRERGLLSELKLVRQTAGVVGLLSEAAQGIRIWRSKPEILRRPPVIAGHEELEAIYSSVDETSVVASRGPGRWRPPSDRPEQRGSNAKAPDASDADRGG